MDIFRKEIETNEVITVNILLKQKLINNFPKSNLINDLSYKFLFKFLDDIINDPDMFHNLVSSEISKKFENSFLNKLTSFKEIDKKFTEIDKEFSNYFNSKTINLIKKNHEGKNMNINYNLKI